MRKMTTAVLAAAMLQTGCFGSFELIKGLYGFNSDVSSNKFVREVVFLGLVILPVYELAFLGDALIFNTLEFWTGDNPVASREVVLEDGSYATLERDGDDVRVTHEGESFLLKRTEEGLRVVRDGEPVAEIVGKGDGAVVLDGSGQVVHVADARELAERERRVEATAPR